MLLKRISEEKLCKVYGCSKQNLTKASEVPSYEYLTHKGWYITPNGNVFEKVINFKDEEDYVYICCGRVFSATIEDIELNELIEDYLNQGWVKPPLFN